MAAARARPRLSTEADTRTARASAATRRSPRTSSPPSPVTSVPPAAGPAGRLDVERGRPEEAAASEAVAAHLTEKVFSSLISSRIQSRSPRWRMTVPAKSLVRLGDVRIDLRHGHWVRILPASQDGGRREESGGIATARERHVTRLVREAGTRTRSSPARGGAARGRGARVGAGRSRGPTRGRLEVGRSVVAPSGSCAVGTDVPSLRATTRAGSPMCDPRPMVCQEPNRPPMTGSRTVSPCPVEPVALRQVAHRTDVLIGGVCIRSFPSPHRVEGRWHVRVLVAPLLPAQCVLVDLRVFAADAVIVNRRWVAH